MAKSEHTPEPWDWDPGDCGEPDAGLRGYPPYVYAPSACDSACTEPMLVCDLKPTDYESNTGQHRRNGDADANARRIVACVNACKGIDDPTDLRKQRDELLEACNAVLDAYRLANPNWSVVANQCAAAIAKAEGGAA